MADKNFIAACQELKEFLGAKLSKEAAKAKITAKQSNTAIIFFIFFIPP